MNCRNTALGAPPLQRLRPLLEAVDPSSVALHNRLQRRRAPLHLSCNGQALTLSWAPQAQPAAADAAPLWLSSRELTGRVQLPHSLRDRLLANADLVAVFDSLAETAQALLLEQALVQVLEPLEALLEQPLKVALRSKSTAPLPLTLRLGVQFADGQAYTLGLELTPIAAQRIADLLDRLLPSQPQPLPGLHLPLTALAGWQVLSINELRSLRPGDLLMLEVPTQGHVQLGLAASHWAAAQRDGASLRLLEGLKRRQPISQPIREHPMSQETENGLDTSLGEVSLNLVCQVGTVQLSLAELQQLGEGSVLTLPEGGSDFVDLLVNGRSVGRGELVKMGDGLGVRLTRFAAL